MTILGWSDVGENGHLVVAGVEDFYDARAYFASRLLKTTPVNQGKWQTLDISKSSAHATYELLNATFWYQMPVSYGEAQHMIHPDLPWAEAHFQERIGGAPINPGVEHANWPYHANGAELHLKDGIYDHNYMERMWPKYLDIRHRGQDWDQGQAFTGYRYHVGDLNDVITQLSTEPGTRQAYLPIWFPEDTGATQGQRVPCSLGYHFIVRGGILHLQYNLRSCEIYRHFTNDIYMAVRLAQHVRDELDLAGYEVELGQLTTHIVSLHGFVADHNKIENMT